MKFADAKPGMIAVGKNGWKHPISKIDTNEKLIFVEEAVFFMLNGRKVGYLESPFDIIALEPAPEPLRVEGWVNVYPNRLSRLQKSHDEAESNRYPDSIDCRHIAYIEGKGIVDITEGEK